MKHLKDIPIDLGVGEGGSTIPKLYDYFKQIDDYIEELKSGGTQGPPGKSAYEIAVENGFEGTEQEWLESLKGKDGRDGEKGEDGKSAYEIAVENGFEGTEQEWLESLKGQDGKDGADGKDGVSVVNATSDGVNIIFELSDGSTIEIPWPTQE